MTSESKAEFDDKMAGDDAYLPRRGEGGFEKYPCCIYFYYIAPNPNQAHDVREYYYKGDANQLRMRDDVEAEIRELTRNARKPAAEQNPKPSGYDWKKMKWKRKSYIAILIDDPGFRFEHKAITFDRLHHGIPNHSFYDAWDKRLNIPMADGAARECPMVVVANHMKDALMRDLGEGVHQIFHFTLHTQPLLASWAKHPDSGGTNMGPPVPPP